MLETNNDLPAVLVVGDGKVAYSIARMLLSAGQETALLTTHVDAAGLAVTDGDDSKTETLTLMSAWPASLAYALVICVTAEDAEEKQAIIERLENRVDKDTLIAVNTEGIPLEVLQADARTPDRILGLNWCYPADLTFFLEIISNPVSAPKHVRFLEYLAQAAWSKQAYTVKTGFSVRARMMAAWAREACYLVENGFASVESVDRACRNDAGHYLPFAGNFRYMDLMGTYAYGMVMKDLNPELCNAAQMPTFIERLLLGGNGPVAQDGGERRLEERYRVFSQEIRELMQRYPEIDEEKTDS